MQDKGMKSPWCLAVSDKVNTSPRRQLSLFRQGLEWYEQIPMMPEERLQVLMESFVEVVNEHELGRRLFGTI